MTPQPRPPRRHLVPGVCLVAALSVPLFAQDQPESTAPVSEDIFELSPFYVRPSEGYVASQSVSASLFAQEISRSPITVDVLTGRLLDDLAATNVNEALRHATNVRPSIDAAVASEQSYTVRGLTANRPTRNYLQQTRVPDRYNVEQVEVMQGPAALPYGRPDPGGLVNLVGKVPTLQDFGQIQIQMGSWETLGALVDLNRAFGRSAALRFNAVHRDRESWREHERAELDAVTVHGLARVGSRTIVRAEVEQGRSRATPPSTVPRFNNRYVESEEIPLASGVLVLPYRWAQSFAGPDAGIDFDWEVAEFTVQHSGFGGRGNLQLVHQEGLLERELLQIINGDLIRPDGTIRAYWNGQSLEENSRYTRLDGSLVTESDLGVLRWVAGLRYDSVVNSVSQKRDFTNLAVNTNPNQWTVRVADIVAGNGPRFDALVRDYRTWVTNVQEFEVAGGYAGLHAELLDRRLNVQGGLRYDENRVQTFPNDSLIASQRRTAYTVEEEGRWTTAIGAVFALREGLSVFVNRGEAFNMTLRRDLEDRFLPPRFTTGIDAGIKANVLGEKLVGTAYLFTIDNRNSFEVVPTNLLPPGAIPGGALSTDDESRGGGIDFVATPAKAVTVRFGYGYVDVERVRGYPQFGLPAGQTVAGHARNNLNLFARWNVGEWAKARWVLGGGVNVRSSVVAGYLDTDGDLLVDSAYTSPGHEEYNLLVSASPRLRRGHRLNLSLNVRNLFDTDYLVPAGLTSATRAQPRSFTFTADFRF